MYVHMCIIYIVYNIIYCIYIRVQAFCDVCFVLFLLTLTNLWTFILCLLVLRREFDTHCSTCKRSHLICRETRTNNYRLGYYYYPYPLLLLLLL